MRATNHPGSGKMLRQARARRLLSSLGRHPLRKACGLGIAGLLVVSAACGSGGAARHASPTTGPPYAVTSGVVADSTTQHIQVWAPAGQGRWPVVYALPGISGHKSDIDQLGPALARRGVLVFATDYNPTATNDEMARDLECGYRYIRSIAPHYGGDLTQPVTAVGYSAGARLVGGLMAPAFGPTGDYDACFAGAPAPDVLVGINGCYYAYKNLKFEFSTDVGTTDVKLVVITGQADDQCATWQSQKAAKALTAAGPRHNPRADPRGQSLHPDLPQLRPRQMDSPASGPRRRDHRAGDPAGNPRRRVSTARARKGFDGGVGISEHR